MKRTECFGIIRITEHCVINVKKQKNCFQIVGNKPLFDAKGPDGLVSATTHRVWHGSAETCVLRCEDDSSFKDWISALLMAISDEKEQLKGSMEMSEIESDEEEEEEEGMERREMIEEEEEEYEWGWSPDVKATIEELRGELRELLIANNSLNDDHLLWRFLNATQFDFDASKKMVENYFEWRNSYRPHEITAEDVSDVLNTDLMRICGKDTQGRAILLIFAGKYNPKTCDSDQVLKFTCYVIEQILKRMKPQYRQISVIADLSNFGMSNLDKNFASSGAMVLQNYYPERLATLACVNCPRIINIVWKFIKPLLDERTKEKISFKGKTLAGEEVYPAECLPRYLGGDSDYLPSPPSIGLELLDS
eukprot:CAMPEP_0174264536 /NCGR_PEP_ID=MMETSP0439-20130205/22757_1 /TAXON_ID=0 /ORGANISM="Stereomyxa ramosa, Strain Chinc5" /LENGTH=363 /DNA_ID=CAMNT_0015350447 /DNA_START=409 /DNA_END=1500 /DNA_ORIENTATION=+